MAAWDENGEQTVELVKAALTYVTDAGPAGGDGEDDAAASSRAVLVFLTGWDEIRKVHEALSEDPVFGKASRFLLLPLHSALPTADQRRIFSRPPPSVRKIVLSTNIAETSITIDDIAYVIDGGRAKEKTYDDVNNLECLLPTWISKAAAHQRRGRAGRVRRGVCIRLYPRWKHESLADFQLPELLRTPLEPLSLQVKSLGLGRVAPFLARALEPPSALAVSHALAQLRAIGALTGEDEEDEEELTPLGRHLARLPVDPRVGKLLVYGALFGCLGPALTIAAALSHRPPFSVPLGKEEQADEAKARFADGTCSDHLAALRAYGAWRRAARDGPRAEERFCWENFLNRSVLGMLADMRVQFLDLLRDIGFADGERGAPLGAMDANADETPLVRAVLCAGLFPNVAAVRNGKRKAIWRTRDDGKVDPHPSSVNAWESQFEYRWMVYNEKVKSVGGIFVRDSTNVSDLALLLFGGPSKAGGGEQGGLEMLGGYVRLETPKRTAELVMRLRRQLDLVLKEKIEDPTRGAAEASTLQQAVITLLREDDGYGEQQAGYGDWYGPRVNPRQRR